MATHDWTQVDAGTFHAVSYGLDHASEWLTCLAAYRGLPAFWRDVLEGRQPRPHESPGTL